MATASEGDKINVAFGKEWIKGFVLRAFKSPPGKVRDHFEDGSIETAVLTKGEFKMLSKGNLSAVFGFKWVRAVGVLVLPRPRPTNRPPALPPPVRAAVCRRPEQVGKEDTEERPSRSSGWLQGEVPVW